MQIGMVGLGRMGANMAERLIKGGHECVVFDMNPDNAVLKHVLLYSKRMDESGGRCDRTNFNEQNRIPLRRG